ncbi:DNA-binding CsgD family transcriptional regulator [Actinokineospora baliensis]|uniref:helix-turn-helix transcriptional regulator n=1 Tax=Actinokineospora baliensis TaxID=547056 RepID=UPI00195D1737|nr:helix-turn-helix transcriptional regulator [Actinokineospora baliensis]MBM7773141.1 DNA-binding CsgD family transcriptional regulator [Actinokineospora baliensis]
MTNGTLSCRRDGALPAAPRGERAEDVVHCAKQHVAVLWRDGVLPLTPRATIALFAGVAGRGVSVQVLCARENLCAAAELGMVELAQPTIEVHLVDRSMPDVIIVDHRAVVFPPGLADDAPTAVLRHSGVVAAARELFTLGWQAALTRYRGPLDGVTGAQLQQEVLTLLGRGHTDDTAARKLGISVRTYRRHVAAIMRDLGAGSRFQAGMLAQERGLV